MAAESANEVSVARHLARRDWLGGISCLKPAFQFLWSKTWATRAHSAKTAFGFRASDRTTADSVNLFVHPIMPLPDHIECATASSPLSNTACRAQIRFEPIWDRRYKTKVWGSANQYDIQINLRRMEQFVSVGLYCDS
jgi:hypothetical protein